MSILRIKDKDGKWVEIPSLNVEVNRKSVRAAIPSLVEYIKDSNSPFVALDGESIPIERMVTGTYAGTGTYGEGNPVVLTFDFKPKIVWVAEKNPQSGIGAAQTCMLNGVTTAFYDRASTHSVLSVRWEGNSVSYYSTSTTTSQYNESGKEYIYYAIGKE